MKRASAEPLTKVTLNLFSRDYERMQELYPQIGATVAIRALVHQHVTKVEAKTARLVDPTLVNELEIEVETDDVIS